MECEAKEKRKLSDLTYEQLVLTRNQLTERVRQAEAAVDAVKAKREKLDQEFLRRFNEQGLTSVKTSLGTPYVITYESYVVADKDAFTNWVEANNALDFMEVRVAKAMARAYKEEHEDLPPGVSYSAKLAIGVRK